jgi:putative membrane protein
MKEQFKRSAAFLTACLPAFIFITWLNAYYWLLKGGHYQAFIQPKLWPLLILAMLLVLAYAAACISRFSLKLEIPLPIDAWLKAAILLLPVLFLWTVYGQSLGSDAFAKSVSNADSNISFGDTYWQKSKFKNESDEGITLLNLFMDSEKFTGRRVAVEGMVYRSVKMEKNSFKLFRFGIVCCAADALPISFMVRDTEGGNLSNDTWVRVEGIFNTATIKGKRISSIAADHIQRIPIPPAEKRYLFF